MGRRKKDKHPEEQPQPQHQPIERAPEEPPREVVEEQPQPQPQQEVVDHGGRQQAGEAASANLDVEEFVRELAKNVDVVENWSVNEVIGQFLTPVGMSHLSQFFYEHKVNGAVLLHMDKIELKEIGFPADTGMRRGLDCKIAIGDRVFLHNLLSIVQKGRRGVDREKVIWRVSVPEGRIQYYDSISDCIKYKCCPCCMFHDVYTLTGRGLEIKHKPPKFCCFVCGPWEVDFNDMRFLKDIDHMEKYLCCCYCPFRQSMMTFGDDDEEGEVGHKRNDKPPTIVLIKHPLMTDSMMAHMRSVWAELRLVEG